MGVAYESFSDYDGTAFNALTAEEQADVLAAAQPDIRSKGNVDAFMRSATSVANLINTLRGGASERRIVLFDNDLAITARNEEATQANVDDVTGVSGSSIADDYAAFYTELNKNNADTTTQDIYIFTAEASRGDINVGGTLSTGNNDAGLFASLPVVTGSTLRDYSIVVVALETYENYDDSDNYRLSTPCGPLVADICITAPGSYFYRSGERTCGDPSFDPDTDDACRTANDIQSYGGTDDVLIRNDAASAERTARAAAALVAGGLAVLESWFGDQISSKDLVDRLLRTAAQDFDVDSRGATGIETEGDGVFDYAGAAGKNRYGQGLMNLECASRPVISPTDARCGRAEAQQGVRNETGAAIQFSGNTFATGAMMTEQVCLSVSLSHLVFDGVCTTVAVEMAAGTPRLDMQGLAEACALRNLILDTVNNACVEACVAAQGVRVAQNVRRCVTPTSPTECGALGRLFDGTTNACTPRAACISSATTVISADDNSCVALATCLQNGEGVREGRCTASPTADSCRLAGGNRNDRGFLDGTTCVAEVTDCSTGLVGLAATAGNRCVQPSACPVGQGVSNNRCTMLLATTPRADRLASCVAAGGRILDQAGTGCVAANGCAAGQLRNNAGDQCVTMCATGEGATASASAGSDRQCVTATTATAEQCRNAMMVRLGGTGGCAAMCAMNNAPTTANQCGAAASVCAATNQGYDATNRVCVVPSGTGATNVAACQALGRLLQAGGRGCVASAAQCAAGSVDDSAGFCAAAATICSTTQAAVRGMCRPIATACTGTQGFDVATRSCVTADEAADCAAFGTSKPVYRMGAGCITAVACRMAQRAVNANECVTASATSCFGDGGQGFVNGRCATASTTSCLATSGYRFDSGTSACVVLRMCSGGTPLVSSDFGSCVAMCGTGEGVSAGSTATIRVCISPTDATAQQCVNNGDIRREMGGCADMCATANNAPDGNGQCGAATTVCTSTQGYNATDRVCVSSPSSAQCVAVGRVRPIASECGNCAAMCPAGGAPQSRWAMRLGR